MYRSLDSDKIIQTVGRLRDRIRERFPESSLSRVAVAFGQVAEQTAGEVQRIARPNFFLRAGIVLLTLLVAAVIAGIALQLKVPTQVDRISELLQAIDAALNTILLLGGAIFFLFTLEVRLKRRRALRLLHELRSLAHIVDVHQLTKDPESVLGGALPTASSPPRTMTGSELGRYLDYCSEMLSLIGKVAALHVQQYDDPVVLSAVDQVEDLTTALANKIWQKIMVLERIRK